MNQKATSMPTVSLLMRFSSGVRQFSFATSQIFSRALAGDAGVSSPATTHRAMVSVDPSHRRLRSGMRGGYEEGDVDMNDPIAIGYAVVMNGRACLPASFASDVPAMMRFRAGEERVRNSRSSDC